MIDYFCKEGPLRPGDAVAALIVLEDGRYLMQLRDQKPGIFYPGHWGLFGGALDPGETVEQALIRELDEELGLRAKDACYVTDLNFACGRFGRVIRYYFAVAISSADLRRLTVREGREMRAFFAAEILTLPRVVAYDSFAIWMHASGLAAQHGDPPRPRP
jgi:8-oxo-dGTP pyrophosphatase MutT (NUDIX family)